MTTLILRKNQVDNSYSIAWFDTVRHEEGAALSLEHLQPADRTEYTQEVKDALAEVHYVINTLKKAEGVIVKKTGELTWSTYDLARKALAVVTEIPQKG